MTGKAGARFEAASQDTGSVVLICPVTPDRGEQGTSPQKRWMRPLCSELVGEPSSKQNSLLKAFFRDLPGEGFFIFRKTFFNGGLCRMNRMI